MPSPVPTVETVTTKGLRNYQREAEVLHTDANHQPQHRGSEKEPGVECRSVLTTKQEKAKSEKPEWHLTAT